MSRDVREQFGPSAAAYLESETHARGPDLARMVELAGLRDGETFVDVGAGAGHTLRAFAAAGPGRAIGIDATPQMLAAARRLLEANGLRATLVQADARALPIRDRSADVVASRLAAHHFADVARAFAEIARVLRPGGVFVLSDNYAPDDRELDRFINTLERLRDATHVREHTIGEWRGYLEEAGFTAEVADRYETTLKIDEWLTRSRTPTERAAEVRRMLAHAPPGAVAEFAIAPTTFQLKRALLVARN